MGTGKDFMEYILDQMAPAGEVSAKKMFGEYGFYLNGKMVALGCDDQLFLKDLPMTREAYPDAEFAPPYEGAKPHLIVADPEDRERLADVLQKLWEVTAFPKPRKKKE